MDKCGFEQKIRGYNIIIRRIKGGGSKEYEAINEYMVPLERVKGEPYALSLCRVITYPDCYKAYFFLSNRGAIFARFDAEEEAYALLDKLIFSPGSVERGDLGKYQSDGGVRIKAIDVQKAYQDIESGCATEDEKLFLRVMPEWADKAFGLLGLKEEG